MSKQIAYRYSIAAALGLCALLGFAQEQRVESVAVRGLRNISETAVLARCASSLGNRSPRQRWRATAVRSTAWDCSARCARA